MKQLYILFFLVFLQSNAQKTNISSNIFVIGYQEKKIPDTLLNVWQHKDIITDTIPGVSAEKAYQNLISKKRDTVIVAIIDSGVDIDHEDLKSQIWVNTLEIPNNAIDDDQNGYVDDINGWNFLGNNKGENNYYARKEYVRLLKNRGIITDKRELVIPKNVEKTDSLVFQAIQFYKNAKKSLQEDKVYIADKLKQYKKIEAELKSYFPDQKYTQKKLSEIDTVKHSNLKESVKALSALLRYDISKEWLENYQKTNSIIENYKLNPNYKDREINNDKVTDINDISYGNNNVKGDPNIENHGTLVAGLLGAVRNNSIGIDGIADRVKLMILRAIPKGDEYDKDIARAIHYAVDNGAKVINMSFGKFFSPQKDIVIEAIAYAAKKDVIIIHAAGNDSKNIDEHDFYPVDYLTKEIEQNFVNVGALNYKLNTKLPAYFSNYGERNVDLFAPGHNLYTTSPNNEYKVSSGTSLASPIVAGVAAMIRSYYPELKANEVKQILMDSGNSYDIQVTIPGKRNSPKEKFSKLSKSGKVVNLYNAMRMASQITKDK